VIVNLMTPNGDYDVLYDMGKCPVDIDLDELVYRVGSQGPGFFDGGEVERDDKEWNALAKKWNALAE